MHSEMEEGEEESLHETGTLSSQRSREVTLGSVGRSRGVISEGLCCDRTCLFAGNVSVWPATFLLDLPGLVL